MSANKKSGPLSLLIKWAVALVALLAIFLFVAWQWFTRPISPTLLQPEEIEQVQSKFAPILAELKQGNAPTGHSLTISERELNGYLHHHTEFGDKVEFELQDGLVIAHIHALLPDNSPVLPGQKVRGKLSIRLGVVDGEPSVELDSASSFGSHFPEQYLKDYMHKNLYKEIKQRLGTEYDVHSLETITVSEGLLKIVFTS